MSDLKELNDDKSAVRREAERQRGLQMAGPLAHLLDGVARDLHNNESLHMHDCTASVGDCGYCYLRAGRTLGVVAIHMRLDKPWWLETRKQQMFGLRIEGEGIAYQSDDREFVEKMLGEIKHLGKNAVLVTWARHWRWTYTPDAAVDVEAPVGGDR